MPTKYQWEWSIAKDRPANLLPVPEHLFYDPQADRVRCFGPFYTQDKRIQDQLRQALAKVTEEIDALTVILKGKRIGPKRRQALVLEYCEKVEFRDQLVRELRPGRVDGRSADANIQIAGT